MKKLYFFTSLLLVLTNTLLADQYPNTSVAIIDINKVLTESKVAINATKQIEEIQISENESAKERDEQIIKERERLIEQQSVMAPEAFEVKVKDFEKKVQDFQIERQEQARSLDQMVQVARSKILDEVKPLLKEYSDELGITVILEKNGANLFDEDMNITNAIIKRLDKKIKKIEVSLDD